VDEAYDATVVRPTLTLADRLWRKVDVGVIDATVNGVASLIGWCGLVLRFLQSGQTQHYALGMAMGAVFILTVYLLF
jgi:NADH-quinone oxidoreductase subunit L